nr:ATP-binding protein [Hufsiella ginkgonis]
MKKGTLRTLGKPNELNITSVACLLLDSKGRIWIGTYDGKVRVIDRASGTVRHLSADLPGSLAFIQEDAAGFFWISSRDKGVYLMEPGLQRMRHIDTTGGLVGDNASGWMEDDERNVWLTSEDGLQRIDAARKLSVVLGTANGLPKKESYSIARRGKLIYVGTVDGLAVVGPVPPEETKSPWPIRVYKKSQGLSHLDFNQGALMFTRGGQLYAGVEQSLLVMEEPPADTTVPAPQISQLDILGKPVFFLPPAPAGDERLRDTVRKAGSDSVIMAKELFDARLKPFREQGISWKNVGGPFNMPGELVLPYDQNYLAFHFTGMQLSNSDNVRYRYILEGIDQVWSQPAAQEVSDSYRDLPPGHYTFKVSAKGFNNTWSAPAIFNFTITPPWWETWWAYVFYALALAALIFALIVYRSRALKRENRLLEEKIANRTRQLKESLDELNSTQSQLIQSAKMASLGELTAGIAHEIQNPLNFVNNFSEVSRELLTELQEEIDAGNMDDVKAIAGNLDQNLGKIHHHGKRADRIVKSMLQHSRSSTGNKEPTDINALADEYLRLSYHGLRAKDKTFNAEMLTDLDPSLPKTNIISQDVGRVLLNLFNNAFQATQERAKNNGTGYKPLVEVKTWQREDGIFISVKDNGNGIPASIREKIFQPFFTTKPSGEGTGLGLSLSYDVIVKLHGGSIEADSQEGASTVFLIRLPISH